MSWLFKKKKKKKFVDINKDFAIIFQRLIGQACSCGVDRIMDERVAFIRYKF